MPVCVCANVSVSCVHVCAAYLNRSICSRACSSAVSFRLDSISAIPLTFSTKRLQERTRAPTQDTHIHTHTKLVLMHSHKQAFIFTDISTNTHMQKQKEMRRQTHTIVCAGCPLGIMSDIANSVSCRYRCQGFHSHSSTQANQIRASLCTIFTSHTLCKSPSPPPPSAHSLQLLWLAVKEDIHPNWCTPT